MNDSPINEVVTCLLPWHFCVDRTGLLLLKLTMIHNQGRFWVTVQSFGYRVLWLSCRNWRNVTFCSFLQKHYKNKWHEPIILWIAGFTQFMCLRGTSILLVDESTGRHLMASVIELVYLYNQSQFLWSLKTLALSINRKFKTNHHRCFEH